MDGLIKRGKNSIPFLPKIPKMTSEYKAAMDDLFFSRNISAIDKDDAIIFLGSPIMINEQLKTFAGQTISQSNSIVLSGGPSPAYKKFTPEFVGASVIEIFKGTFAFDIKKPESIRVADRLYKLFPEYSGINIMKEQSSTNTYENIYKSRKMIKDFGSKRVVLAGTIEQIPRAIETLKTVAGDDINVAGLPYNPQIKDKWHKSLWNRSRFAAEVKRLDAYSNASNPKVKNQIKLSEETRAKLRKVLELTR